MIVSITGGTGFIGRQLALRHLSAGDRVRVLSRSRGPVGLPASVQFHQGDLVEGPVEPLHGFLDGAEVLYHCAGELRDRARMREVHVRGTRRLLEAAEGRIKHWVQLSSVGVYGPRSAGIVTEDAPCQPQGDYETTKAEADRILIEEASSRGLSFSILRPSIVFGPGMPNQSLFQMIRMIEKGRFFFIGSSGASANYIHVDGVVEALMLCARLPAAKGRIYNLSDHRTLEEFVGAIAGALEIRPPRLRMPEGPVRLAARLGKLVPAFPLTPSRIDALVGRTLYPSGRIERELGYRHVTSMEEGLRQLVEAWWSRA